MCRQRCSAQLPLTAGEGRSATPLIATEALRPTQGVPACTTGWVMTMRSGPLTSNVNDNLVDVTEPSRWVVRLRDHTTNHDTNDEGDPILLLS
jgi:hypothetical protein